MNRAALLVTLALGFLGVGAGSVFAFRMLGAGLDGLVTVDPPPELRSEFALLEAMPLACSISYGSRSIRGMNADERRYGTVYVRDCEEFHGSGAVSVPETWGRQGLRFEMERSAVGEPWELEVATESAPREVLVEALRAFTPLIVSQGPSLLAADIAGLDEANRAYEAREAASRSAAESNSASY